MNWFSTLYNDPLIKTHWVICDALHDYSRIKWKHTLLNLEKARDVASQDVLNEHDWIWGVKDLNVTRSNLVVTWKVRPHMSIISWFPLGLCCFSFLQLIFQFVQKIKNKPKNNGWKKVTMKNVTFFLDENDHLHDNA